MSSDVDAMSDAQYAAYVNERVQKLRATSLHTVKEQGKKSPTTTLEDIIDSANTAFENGLCTYVYQPVQEDPDDQICRIESNEHDPNDEYPCLKLCISRDVYETRKDKILPFVENLSMTQKTCCIELDLRGQMQCQEATVRPFFLNTHYQDDDGSVVWVVWKEADIKRIVESLKILFPRTLRL